MITQDAYNGCNACRFGRHDYCSNKECFADEHKCCCDCRAHDRARKLEKR